MKVRDAIRLVERDGWYHVRHEASNRQYKHRKIRYRYHCRESQPRASSQDNEHYSEAGRFEMSNAMRYRVEFEGNDESSAYLPELPGVGGRDVRGNQRSHLKPWQLHKELMEEEAAHVLSRSPNA